MNCPSFIIQCRHLVNVRYKRLCDSNVRRIFVIPAHCHLLDFDRYSHCNDVIFSQSTRGFHFVWMPWKLTRDYNRQCLLVQTFCTNSVAANRTNLFILSKSCLQNMCCLHSPFWLVATTTSCITYKPSPCHRATSKIRLTMPRVKMSRANRNPWLAKM